MHTLITHKYSVVKIVYILFSLAFLLYLSLPSPNFPLQLPESLQSTEPADVETPFRRSYFSDWTREQIISHYSSDFSSQLVFLPGVRLNYPPEEAQTIIRDQTRSSFLEEIVHPFRESIFVNGYEPKDNKDIIFVNDKNWNHKVTVRLVTSTNLARVMVGLSAILFIPLVLRELVSLVAVSYLILKRVRV